MSVKNRRTTSSSYKSTVDEQHSIKKILKYQQKRHTLYLLPMTCNICLYIMACNICLYIMAYNICNNYF